ncbi:MAG: ATP-binding cassette domain-containing protein [Blastococcus sp.]
MTAPVLEVTDLRVRLRTPRGPAEVVNGLTYSVGAGETVAVVGESGSGKSVSVLALLGLLPAGIATVSGQALLDGEDLLAMSPERLRRVRGPGAGMVFQDPMTSLNPVLTVGRQLVRASERTPTCRRPPPAAGPPTCSARWAWPTPWPPSTGSRTSSPAACGSG